MPLIDVVNFNSDASCLSSRKWLRCLEGGRESLLVGVLSAYVRSRRKVNLGFIGATVKDIARYNPEAIEVVNEHPDVFEIVVRPFAHDNPLLRLPSGFRYNVEEGLETLRRSFARTGTFYLAPEIMVNGEQIRILHDLGITGIFLHKGRYDLSVSRHVPDDPFVLYGVFGTAMLCVPFSAKELESMYLRALHGSASAEQWAAAARAASEKRQVAIWRDGESALMHPLEPEHEAALLAAEERAGVERRFLSEIDRTSPPAADGTLRYFPLHSLKPWLDAMKLYWYVERVQRVEQAIETLPDDVKRLWLLTINSDILSSAEKRPPVVDVHEDVLRVAPDDVLWDGVIPLPESKQVILTRSERAGEGEDYLAYLELLISGRATIENICAEWRQRSEPHLKKALARVCD